MVLHVVVDHFGESVAAEYDSDSTDMFSPAVLGPAVEFLAELAGAGAALELGIGTGRVALPLSERGVPVHGIDLSEAMLARLRAKPGSERIGVTTGDFATTRVPGEFSLVYLVFNTINNLTTQDEQVECFRNAARHLAPGGHFVIEVGVPALQKLPIGEAHVLFDVQEDHIGIDEYELVDQGLVSHHFWVRDGRWHRNAVPFRYAWPAELDLMARLAGMLRVERWADWDRSPFTATSTRHVSVWRKPVT
ncbi:class I SAM-dependent methyltransferase [Saccharopolyspora rhizosphaerae]|uniref:Class I SAM-dependent methyltransferase n=1 Tax=Saccharopolyspora rhizosphaerae TaxID=2492662 RepID=A0A3R8P1K9_9PSEU|nr:class I SAM-dependent methyltransferase [Saccharopolyspora rhizosphaerae]RRO18015.1 class I SAM-dependent methyltransferase [Saccharopolyspora rhizosphaerae]